MKSSTAPLPPLQSVKVIEQLRERIRYLHYSIRTEDAYEPRAKLPHTKCGATRSALLKPIFASET